MHLQNIFNDLKLNFTSTTYHFGGNVFPLISTGAFNIPVRVNVSRLTI
jgi:hypothetical protein